jgi:hypothetical protein
MLGSVVVCLLSLMILAAAYWSWSVGVMKRAMVMNLCLDAEETDEKVDVGRISGRAVSGRAIVPAVLAFLCFYFGELRTDTRIVLAVMVAGGGVLVSQRLQESRKPSNAAVLRQIAYELPLVMERIVMAVQAGHDILPALKIILNSGENNSSKGERDSQVLKCIREVVDATEAGMTLQSSLRTASMNTNSVALRHALLHIAVAHEKGGGLLFSLSELADATQSYYQESVEEQIATLPVKATFPLVVVFGGLLVILLTSPIIQILDTTVSYGVMK